MPLQLFAMHFPIFNFASTKCPGIFLLLQRTVPRTFILFLLKVRNNFGEEYQLSIYNVCPLFSIDFSNSITTVSDALQSGFILPSPEYILQL
jgi:hypothetical protein